MGTIGSRGIGKLVKFSTRRESLPAEAGSRTPRHTSGSLEDGLLTPDIEAMYPSVMSN